MDVTSYSAVRANLASQMRRVCDDHAPLVISRRGEPSVVMLSLEDYNALEETAHLLRSPVNAQRLLSAITALESGGGEEHDLLPVD
ncbi:MAG: type II toxin-antitoxin system prevent-host-death family antitoxin [Cyanobacteria bacterium K_DeepCast_35m_m2_155]|nr:type II toxin-antitoxin system prevent-host-death family antitoxin [Cyanobacteria bacterium K_DeepCast_35m_m2_155]